jgi:hypothetical protein
MGLKKERKEERVMLDATVASRAHLAGDYSVGYPRAVMDVE